jgi:hypothetical protein
VAKTFRAFHPGDLLPDLLKLTIATAAAMLAGLIASQVPPPAIFNQRWMALMELGEVFIACVLAAWPALMLTKSITGAEGKTLMGIILPGRIGGEQPCVDVVT